MAVIYRHLKPCGEVFYIGIGNDKSRAYVKKNRSEYWKNIVDKHGYEVQILKSDLTMEDAKELEIILIDYYGRRDLGKGTLVNLTDGGDGANPSEETKQKLRDINLGKKWTEEQRKNTHESIAKYIDNKKVCICTKTLKTWGSISRCAKDLGIHPSTLRLLISPKEKVKNYTDIMLYEDYMGDRVKEPFKGKRLRGNNKCINTLTEEIFESISEASKSIDMKTIILRRMLNGDYINRTYIIILENYKEEIHYPETRKKKQGKPLRNITTKEVFPTMGELASHLGVSKTTTKRWVDKQKIDYEYID